MKRSNGLIGRIWLLMALVIIPAVLNGCGGGSGGSSTDGKTVAGISLSITQLDFGGVVIDSSADRSIVIENSGTAGLTVGQVGQPEAPFEVIEDKCSGQLLPPGSTCNLIVRFSPVEQTSYASKLAIPSSAGEDIPEVDLQGSGTGLDVSINRINARACPSGQTISLLVSVADRYGDAVLGLQSAHFEVSENGEAIPSVNLNTAYATLPVSVGLVLDYSSSMNSFTESLETAAIDFLGLLATEDEAAIVKFAKQFEMVQDFTTDKSVLTAAVKEPPPFERKGTSLYDAVRLAIDNTAARTDSRQAVVAVSDGNDFDSQSTLDELIAHALEAGIPVFTIGLGEDIAEQMQRLAGETGGQYFPATPSSLQTVYTQVSRLLSNQYLIEYASSASAAETILVRVEVEDDDGNIGADSRELTINTL